MDGHSEIAPFGKHLFCKTKTDYDCKTLCTRISLSISAITKSFAVFLGEVIKTIETFPVFA